jgi:hypothetical protein
MSGTIAERPTVFRDRSKQRHIDRLLSNETLCSNTREFAAPITSDHSIGTTLDWRGRGMGVLLLADRTIYGHAGPPCMWTTPTAGPLIDDV